MIVNTNLPDNFNSLPLLKQESILVEILKKIREADDIIFQQLAKVRGGQKIQVSEEIHIHETTLK